MIKENWTKTRALKKIITKNDLLVIKNIGGSMQNFIIVLLTALLLPLSPTLSAACSGIRYHFSWTEPKVNADGSYLTDLAGTMLYYKLNGGIEKSKFYKASKPIGGGTHSAYITIVMNCETKANNIEAWIIAENASGGKSAKGNVIIRQIPILGVGGGL